MISVSPDEILARSAGIPAVLQILHKLYPAMTSEKLHPGKAESLFYIAGIPLC